MLTPMKTELRQATQQLMKQLDAGQYGWGPFSFLSSMGWRNELLRRTLWRRVPFQPELLYYKQKPLTFLNLKWFGSELESKTKRFDYQIEAAGPEGWKSNRSIDFRMYTFGNVLRETVGGED